MHDLPMKEPILQIKLKRQLSGGRVPHLLQGERGGREGRQREKRSEQKQTSRKQKHELSTELVKANIHEEFNALMARGQNDSKTATYFES